MDNDSLPVVKSKRVPRLFGIAFGLVKIGQRFNYRTVQAVKASNRDAVLIPSGKFIRVESTKLVKVRG